MLQKFKIDYIPYFINLRKKLTEEELIIYGFIKIYFKLYPSSNFYFTNLQISKVLDIETKNIGKKIISLQKKNFIKIKKKISVKGRYREIRLSDQDTSYDA